MQTNQEGRMERGVWQAVVPAEDGFYWVYDRDYRQTFVADLVQGEVYLLGDAISCVAGSGRFLIYSTPLRPPLLPPSVWATRPPSLQDGGCV